MNYRDNYEQNICGLRFVRSLSHPGYSFETPDGKQAEAYLTDAHFEFELTAIFFVTVDGQKLNRWFLNVYDIAAYFLDKEKTKHIVHKPARHRSRPQHHATAVVKTNGKTTVYRKVGA